ERLRYTIDVSDDALGCRIPPLSVQTLVENSVKYAVSPARNGAEIRVRARVEGASVRIEGASERVERQSERVERQSERVEGQSERVERQSVRIEVADTGAGFSTADITTGHGLDVLRRRLTAMLGAPEPLAVSREGGWTTVSFRVPA